MVTKSSSAVHANDLLANPPRAHYHNGTVHS